MYNPIRQTVLLAILLVLSGRALSAQAPDPAWQFVPRMEVAVNYSATRANTVPGTNFWLQGGTAQVCGHFSRHWGVAADVTGVHTASVRGVGTGLDLITAVFGPRYVLTPSNGRYRVFGQALVGEANGLNGIFPSPSGATSSANGPALMIGGGLDFRISYRTFVRALNASWLRTDLSNGTTLVQNNLILGSGLGIRF